MSAGRRAAVRLLREAAAALDDYQRGLPDTLAASAQWREETGTTRPHDWMWFAMTSPAPTRRST